MAKKKNILFKKGKKRCMVIAAGVSLLLMSSVALAGSVSDEEYVDGEKYYYTLTVNAQAAPATTVYYADECDYTIYTYVTGVEYRITDTADTRTLTDSVSRYFAKGAMPTGITAVVTSDSGYAMARACSTHVVSVGGRQVVRYLEEEIKKLP